MSQIAKQIGSSPKGRNFFINGNFDFMQRFDPTAPVVMTTSATAYVIDRIQAIRSVSPAFQLNVSRDADVPTLLESGFQSAASYKAELVSLGGAFGAEDDLRIFSSKMEGLHIRSLFGKTVSFQFWVKASRAGIHSFALGNQGTVQSYVTEFVVNTANVWEFKKIDVLLDSTIMSPIIIDNTEALRIIVAPFKSPNSRTTGTLDQWQSGQFYGSANQPLATAGETVRLAQFQMVEGTKAIPFNLSGGNYEGELALAQRYFEKSYDVNTAVGTSTVNGRHVSAAFQIGATDVDNQGVQYKVRKRVQTPTVGIYNAAGTQNLMLWIGVGTSNSNHASFNVQEPSDKGFTLRTTGITTGVRGNANLIAFHWTSDGEL